MSFESALRTITDASGESIWDVPEGWRQGRGAFGGLTLAVLARSASGDPGDVAKSIALVALTDAWFPSVLPVITAMRPFGTISFAAHLFERDWSLEEPLYHRSRLVGSQQGYFVEIRELFTPRGELCAINQQTMAIIK
jgi:hypothetical protein